MIIDLSLPIDDTLKETHGAKIDRISHAQGVEHFNWVVMNKQPGGQERFDKGERVASADEIPNGEMLSLEIVHSSVHMGTHVDAPFHYGSQCEGKPAKTIMNIPLEWCYGPGVVLDFTHMSYPQNIAKEDVVAALDKINYKLKPMDIAARIRRNQPLVTIHTYPQFIEQAKRAIYEGRDSMDVMVLELPYIFGVMPGRVPLWKDILVDMLQKMPNVSYPEGGTNMIAVENVAEAIVGAIYHGKAGTRYPIGDVNMSWKEMLGIMLKGLGLKKKILTLPKWIANIIGRKMKWDDKRHGVEGGLDPVHLFRDIMTKCLYFDSEAIANHLGYSRGNVPDAIEKTMHACLPLS